ncbi:MAG TPA: substrate-binding domain-containing protein [Gemmatimonadales bacterium]
MDGRTVRRLGAPWLGLTAALLGVYPSKRPAVQSHDVLLATTTSTRDAGLLDSLLPVFEKQSGYTVKVIAVGSGEALQLGRRGDADVVLAHAPAAERALADSGYFVRRRLVMHNMFLIVGPPDDPARVRDMRSAVAALRRIDSLGAPFVSRGDHSGTHLRELELWRRGGVSAPAGVWYMESGQGMGQTLQMAEEKRAYVLTDIATYLAWRDRVSLVPLVQGDPALYNVYHVLELNPKNAPRINVEGGRALADFFVAPATQRLIGEFGRRRFRQSLFVPDAGKVDTW